MSSGQNSTANSTQATKGKSDIAWAHVIEGQDANGKKTYSCMNCGKTIKGKGINRMKQHLAKKLGEVGPCKKVNPNIQYQMHESLKAFEEKKKQSEENYDQLNPYGPGGFQFEGDDVYVNVDDEADEVVGTIPRNNKGISINEGAESGNKSRAPMIQKGKGKRHEPTKIGDYFAPRTTPGSQPTIKSALQTKEGIHRAHMIVGKLFYDTCIPINAVNSIYFQPMFDAAIAIGPGYKVPTYHQLRVSLLRDSKKELQLYVDTLKSSWATCGCTIMDDGWTDDRQRNLINFLVYSPMGIAFVKPIDTSNAVKDATLLSKLFLEVIEWVGVSNVVHMVTDNGANYKAAEGLVNVTYKSINWSPCAAHCLNLILSEISKMNHVHELAIKASTVTRYIYNRSWLLA
ncbi:unnamed protein product [Camellia sinensis]